MTLYTKNNMPTDHQLQLALAKIAPNILREMYGTEGENLHFEWQIPERRTRVIQDTEWLHVCWLVEQGLSDTEHEVHRVALWSLVEESDGLERVTQYERANNRSYCSTSWQQRALTLAKVKGVEVV